MTAPKQRSGAHERGRPPMHVRTDRQRPHARTTATAHRYPGPQRPPTHPQRPSV
ncbi:hypothetical protein K443DRAFT_685292, partial [Laccaria amethystina LaAM-08-1]